MAWLIVNGFKDVENRSRRTNYRGPILIHAGLNPANFSEKEVNRIKLRHGVTVPDELDIGGIIGVVDMVDCVEKHRSKWFNRTGQPGNRARGTKVSLGYLEFRLAPRELALIRADYRTQVGRAIE